MARQTSDEGSRKAAGLSRTTILLLAGFMAGMTAGVSAPYALFCVAVATVSIVAYLALELTALRRARDDELAQEGEALPSQGWSRREQRRSLRYAVPAEQQEATLKVGQAKLSVRLVNVSTGGFRIRLSRDPGVEVGQVVWIRTDAGWDEVRVVETVPEVEGHRIRLQICSAAKPWNQHRHEQYRRPRSRLVARLPIVCGVVVAISMVLAPFVRNAFIDKSTTALSVFSKRGRKEPDPAKESQSGAVQAARSSVRSAVPDRTGVTGASARLPEPGERPVANHVRPAPVGENPAELSQRGTGHRTLPDPGPERPRPGTAPAAVRSKLTEAIDTILRDVVGPGSEQPLVVRGLGDDPDSVSGVPQRTGAGGTGRSVPGSDRDRAKAVGAFDRGLRSFWELEYGSAVVAFGEAIESCPEDATYRYFLALSYFRAGQRERAEEALAAAVEVESEHPAPDLNRLLQRVQGPHRRWMQAARSKAQVGPYRPRR